MSERSISAKRVAALSVVVAIPAAILVRVLLPISDDIPDPEGAQVPFLAVLGAFEALAFGLAVSVVVFGLPVVRRAAASAPVPTWAAFGSAVWLLGNWWIHDALHLYNGDSLNGLIGIEYGFHVTSMATGLVLALSLLALARRRESRAAPAAGVAATAD